LPWAQPTVLEFEVPHPKIYRSPEARAPISDFSRARARPVRRDSYRNGESALARGRLRISALYWNFQPIHWNRAGQGLCPRTESKTEARARLRGGTSWSVYSQAPTSTARPFVSHVPTQLVREGCAASNNQSGGICQAHRTQYRGSKAPSGMQRRL